MCPFPSHAQDVPRASRLPEDDPLHDLLLHGPLDDLLDDTLDHLDDDLVDLLVHPLDVL